MHRILSGIKSEAEVQTWRSTYSHQTGSYPHLLTWAPDIAAGPACRTPTCSEVLAIDPVDHILDRPGTPQTQRRIWDLVSHSPLRCLWNLEGIPFSVIARHTWRATLDDNLVGRSAELGFYFIFALFPSLFMATSILGLAARSASKIYYSLLGYLSVVIPHAALGTVLETFHQTTAATTSGKLTFGLIFAIWSASVGFSAIQDSLNVVYKVKESRSYLAARMSAIGVTVLLMVLLTLILSSLLGADFFARLAYLRIHHHLFAVVIAIAIRLVSWLFAAALLSMFFAVIYYFAPDVKTAHWHWLTPGSAVGILGWILASIGLRVYVHLFGNYSLTYGSLGAVIILLTWFYLSGLMLLVGAEINSEIEAAAAAKLLLESQQISLSPAAASPDSVPSNASAVSNDSQNNPQKNPQTAA
jgi:membrane protein